MKLVLSKRVAEIYESDKLVARLENGDDGCLNVHISDPKLVSVIRIDGASIEVEGGIAAIDVQQQCE